MNVNILLLALIAAAPALAAPVVLPPPPPTDAQCAALPRPKGQLAFGPGEHLEFTLDALGAEAGKLVLEVQPPRDGRLRVHAEAQTNTFFSKIRKVQGNGTSYLDLTTLRPQRYVEDSIENAIHRTAEVSFSPKLRTVAIAFTVNGKPGRRSYRSATDTLDVVGALFALRELPFRKDLPVCFDAYGIRRMWRVWGKVEGKEHVSLPIGEFDAWHLSGHAVRVDDWRQRREIHVWISADKRRLPLVAVGAIDLGAVRATLTEWSRPGEGHKKAQTARDMSW